jgi:hypothetical protein
MKRSGVRSRRGRRGVALLYALMASFAVATMVTGMFALTSSSKTLTEVRVRGTQARYLAEGAVEIAKNGVQTAIANWKTPTSGTATIQGVQVPYTVTATGLDTIRTDPAGIQTIVTGYAIEATASENGHSYTAHRLVNAEATPVFQFAVFYTNDLEINPGPNMTLGGRVHTNQDMYLNCGGTLTCNTNYVHAVGSIFRNRKDDPSLSEGTVLIRKYVQNPFSGSEPTVYTQMNSTSQMAGLGITTTSGYDARFDQNVDTNGDGDFTDPGDWQKWVLGALALWGPPTGYSTASGNTVMDSAHGVGEAEVPYIGSIKMFEPTTGGDYAWDLVSQSYQPVAPGTGTHAKGYYHSQAGLTILTNAAGTSWKAYNASGADVTAALSASGAVALRSLYDARQAGSSAVSTKVKVTEIDVAKLNTSGLYPSNGLLYAASYGAGTGTNAKGIKLKNGSQLSGKLTVVSENSIYIQGDFNTTNKKGAAVIADAVNLLSNSWSDSKTSSSGLPTASATTYNVAMISGNQDTVGSTYNGGLENLPRFHENWSGKNCTIRGSFVNTWLSQYATSTWVYGGNRYTAPNRVWSYDVAFNTVANLPPYTPMAVTVVDAAVW